MPDRETTQRARRAKRQGKSKSTQAGEFVREEVHHIREGKHGARSTEQAIAIGLSKARRAGVDVRPSKRSSSESKRKAESDARKGRATVRRKASSTRSRATKEALKREGGEAAAPKALARHARVAARRRSSSERSKSALEAARTKGPAKRRAAAKKAAETRAEH